MRQNEPWEIALFFALSLSSPPIGMALSSFLYHPTPEAPPLPSPIYFFPFCLFSPKREITHRGIRQRLTWAIPFLLGESSSSQETPPYSTAEGSGGRHKKSGKCTHTFLSRTDLLGFLYPALILFFKSVESSVKPG